MGSYREGFDEEGVDVGAASDFLLERDGLGAELIVGKLGHGRAEGVDCVDTFLVPRPSLLPRVTLE